MRLKSSTITITDQFCGGGGSGQGAKRVAARLPGVELKMALNHWKLATETYATNFPEAWVDCTDISACDPRRYPSTNILMTSPECTTHSPAGGNTHKALKKQMDLFNSGKIDPATERSRATMWDVVRFAEYHEYETIIAENVVEAARWALFDTWLIAMRNLGYEHRICCLNSMHFWPCPQSRDRMYIVFWKKGNRAPRLDYTPLAHCHSCSRDVKSVQTWKDGRKRVGKYGTRQQYVYCCPSCAKVVEPYYYASANIIDWSNRGQRIGDRERPLSPKTRARVQHGLDTYGLQPVLINDQHDIKWSGMQVRGMEEALPTVQTIPALRAMFPPFIVNDQQTTGIDFRVRGMAEQLPTIPTTHGLKAVFPPFIIREENASRAPQLRTIIDAMRTQTTCQSDGLVVPPFLVEMHSNGKSMPATSPLNCITAGGRKTGIVTGETWNAFMAAYYGGSMCTNHFTEVMGTQTVTDRYSVLQYNVPEVDECYFRMITPYEVKLGMAYEPDHVLLGTSRDQVKMCGNGVTPPAMEWLVERCVESLS